MSARDLLLDLTATRDDLPVQIVLKNGMNIVCPRRCKIELDPDIGAEALESFQGDGDPDLLVGMLVMPVPGGQQHLVKCLFDPDDISAVVFLPEEALPKISNDRPPVPRGGRTPSGLVIP